MWGTNQVLSRHTRWITFGLVLLTAMMNPVAAQTIDSMSPQQPQAGTAPSSSQGGLSAGLATPVPAGVTIKYWTSRIEAYDFFAKWSISDKNYQVHFDYLTHDYNQLFMDDGDSPVYYGLGLRVVDKKGDDLVTGIRIPIGFSYLPHNKPFDLFAEAAPRMNFTPSTKFGLDLQVGIRYRLFK